MSLCQTMKDAVKKVFKRMIEIDVIEKIDQPTDWVNSVVYVRKPSGELRICLKHNTKIISF